MKYRTVLSAKAVKFLDRLDRKTEQRIQTRLEELAADPFDPRISKQLETEELRRYSRVGAWRIVYEINAEDDLIYIITIQHRSRVYKKLKK